MSTVVSPDAPLRISRRERLRRSRPLRDFRSNRAALVSTLFVLLLVLAAILAPILVTHDPAQQALSSQFQGPSGEHLLGTDMYGRDVYSRLLYAARVTLLAVVEAVAIASLLGIPLGLLAGYVGRALDTILSRIFDALLALPPLILAIAIVGILGPGLTNAMLAIGVVLAPPQFRLARGAATSVATETYIDAARAVGCSRWRILWRHVLPNASSPLLVQVTLAAGVVVMAEASLSFLGLGVQAPESSWGSMLRDAFDNIYQSPWFILPPALMIVLTTLAFSTIGDGLRDALEGRGSTKPRRKSWRSRRVARSRTSAEQGSGDAS